MPISSRIRRIFNGSAGLVDGDARAVYEMPDGSILETAVEPPVQGVIDMPAANTLYIAGRAVEIVATAAGLVTLTYIDGSTRTRSFAVGLSRLPDAVTKWVLPGGSAFVGTLCNLK